MTQHAAPLDTEEVIRLLRMTSTLLHSGLSTVPDAWLSWHPAQGEWCIKEVLGHLIEAEGRGFAGRIGIILGQPDPALETWNQEEVARARRDCRRECGELLAEFRALRDPALEMVARLRPEDLPRGGHHPEVGYLTVAELLAEWVFHDQNHVRQMLANLQAYAWPLMGNARRFYEE